MKPKARAKGVDNYHDFDQTCVGGSSECWGMMCHKKSCNVHSGGNTVVAPPACHYRGAGIPLHLLFISLPSVPHSNTGVPLHHLHAVPQWYGRAAVSALGIEMASQYSGTPVPLKGQFPSDELVVCVLANNCHKDVWGETKSSRKTGGQLS